MLHIKALAGAGVVGALLVSAAAGCGGSAKVNHNVVAATGDVKITGCTVSPGGLPIAQIKVDNHTSTAADYVTVVNFTINGVTTASFPGFERGVPAGKSITASVTGSSPVAKTSKISCSIASVQRNGEVTITPTT